jgi:hypothetical protein
MHAGGTIDAAYVFPAFEHLGLDHFLILTAEQLGRRCNVLFIDAGKRARALHSSQPELRKIGSRAAGSVTPLGGRVTGAQRWEQ